MIGNIVKAAVDVQISLNIILLECTLVEYTLVEYALVNQSRFKRQLYMVLQVVLQNYLEQFDSNLSLDENIEKLFFSRNGFFSEEQIKTVITGEKSNPVAYNSIIDAIANGKTKYNEIQTKTGMSDISFCLKNLIASEIVERRETPKPYYIISDSMVNFYFRYVAPGASLINSGKGKIYYEQKVKQNLHQFMGSVFEKMAKDYILSNVGTKKFLVF